MDVHDDITSEETEQESFKTGFEIDDDYVVDSEPLLNSNRHLDDQNAKAWQQAYTLASSYFHEGATLLGTAFATLQERFSLRTIYISGVLGLVISIGLVVAASWPHKRSPVPIGPHWKGFKNIDTYFAFGDSWTTSHFYIDGEQPSTKNPFGNPEFPGSTSSNGPNYVGYLGAKYNQSFIKIYDLAFAGSVVDTHNDVALYDWLDFAHQLKDEFLDHYTINNTAPKDWVPSRTLFSIFFGINDVCVMNTTRHLDKTLASYESFINQLYAAGARNFVIMNVPPLRFAPNIYKGPAERMNRIDRDVAAFNDMLSRIAQDLRERYDDITVFDFDVNNLFTRVVQHPKTFPETSGYKNVKSNCPEYEKNLPGMEQADGTMIANCGGLQVKEYLWKDELHVTSPVHELMAVGIRRLLVSNGTDFI